ncbi:MAG: hypothetical protein AB7U45_03725 [Desulfamplus sp.]
MTLKTENEHIEKVLDELDRCYYFAIDWMDKYEYAFERNGIMGIFLSDLLNSDQEKGKLYNFTYDRFELLKFFHEIKKHLTTIIKTRIPHTKRRAKIIESAKAAKLLLVDNFYDKIEETKLWFFDSGLLSCGKDLDEEGYDKDKIFDLWKDRASLPARERYSCNEDKVMCCKRFEEKLSQANENFDFIVEKTNEFSKYVTTYCAC